MKRRESTVSTEHSVGTGDGIDRARQSELRLYMFLMFPLWPVIMLICTLTLVYQLAKKAFTRSAPTALTIVGYFRWLFLPLRLIRIASKEGNHRLLWGTILLVLFMIPTMIGPLFLVIPENKSPELTTPHPPILYRMFGESGEGLFGTDSRGVGIERSILLGAWQVYITSLIGITFVLGCGLLLGKLTFHPGAKVLVMFFVQIVEAIPVVFLLLVVVAVFGWWESAWRDLGGIVQFCGYMASVVIVGVLTGFGFLPRLIRLVEERIKTFVSENFVDALKAHGIDQDKILWYHIIKKNCLGDILVAITQIWGGIILLSISMDYLGSIFPSLGVKMYSGWAQLLLTPETTKALLFLKELRFTGWWLWFFPVMFITITVTGFYLFGDGLRVRHNQREIEQDNVVTEFDRMVQIIAERFRL
jgi:peptide/nickel transport system permease protein